MGLRSAARWAAASMVSATAAVVAAAVVVAVAAAGGSAARAGSPQARPAHTPRQARPVMSAREVRGRRRDGACPRVRVNGRDMDRLLFSRGPEQRRTDDYAREG